MIETTTGFLTLQSSSRIHLPAPFLSSPALRFDGEPPSLTSRGGFLPSSRRVTLEVVTTPAGLSTITTNQNGTRYKKKKLSANGMQLTPSRAFLSLSLSLYVSVKLKQKKTGAAATRGRRI